MNRRLISICTSLMLLGALVTACAGAQTPDGGGSSAPEASASTPAATVPASPSLSPEPSASESPAETPASQEPEAGPVEKTYRMNKNYFIVPIDKEKTDGKVVLLTFDDGPKAPETLDPLLDTLDKHQAKAIFFVNGYRVKANPDLLKKIDERGQTIGNHSWDHIELKKEQAPKIKEQIESVQEIVKDITGKAPVFFRPPHGSSNDSVRQIAKDNDLLFMTWSNGSLDWDMGKISEDKRPQAVIDNVLEQLHSGSNILMHELPWTAKALDELLTQLEDKGYSFVDPDAIDTEL
ncbi:xylanase deacetylase [Cohnella sp. CIP 111063]|uniref:polysaccharide deacetylase family protein n=1 Tax=unclassified Cohnella TaxID=2636738 RepID=UPI000B8C3F05|nr:MULTISPECIES: polysaccharide deacetylase family protein [unclassified Cohnella]OXS61224.1 xylanase deacetylase [Cohnella sp. CIP 111063]PRX73792.1 peptidoglycan/xylan/chitin deacetylase (PgdA/CDA1 family) [Cohnella sp. SGD-V74]